MTETTEADVDVERFSTARLAAYINEVAPVAANLPDDAPAVDTLRANAEAAIAEFRARNAVADGGEVTVDAVLDDEHGDRDHYLRHVSDSDTTFMVRHERNTHTTVEDGQIVHKVVESYDRDAPVESLSFAGRVTCPVHGGHEAEYDDDHTARHTCPEDDCPFEVVVGRRMTDRDDVDPTDADAPTFYRATIPDDGVSTDFEDVDEWEAKVDDYEDDDLTTFANVVRTLALEKYVGAVNDKAHVSPEYDDDMNKTAEAYVDTFECSRCGDEWETPAKKTHEHFGDVCPSCEGATVWSVDDADLPDDVEARMSEHKSFDANHITSLLRDVIYWGNYVAGVDAATDGGMFDSDDEVDPEDVGPVKTGEQGRVSTGRGDTGKPGTGLRRPKGFAHKFRYFRTVLRDAEDTGLIARADDRDTDVDDPDAAWVATDKGRDVFDALSTCPTCGADKVPMLRTSHYSAGRRTEVSRSLGLSCPSCDDTHSAGTGMSSNGWNLTNLPGVDYDDE
jgi:hypothetical protein